MKNCLTKIGTSKRWHYPVEWKKKWKRRSYHDVSLTRTILTRTEADLKVVFLFYYFYFLFADPDIGYQMSSTNAAEDCCYEHCTEHGLCVRNSSACDRGDDADQRPLCVEKVPLQVEESECMDFSPTSGGGDRARPAPRPLVSLLLPVSLLLLATCARTATAATAPTAAVTWTRGPRHAPQTLLLYVSYDCCIIRRHSIVMPPMLYYCVPPPSPGYRTRQHRGAVPSQLLYKRRRSHPRSEKLGARFSRREM